MSRGSRIALVTLGLFATVGCGPSSYRDFREQIAEATCARARKCGKVGAADRALCPVDEALALFHDTAQDRATAGAIDVAGSIDTGRLRYDSVNAQDCLDAVSSAPCDDELAATRRLAACAAVVVPHTETDRPCWSDLECTGGVCLRAPGCSGFCGAYASFGAACTDDPTTPLPGRCDPTVGFCASVDGAPATCQRRKKEGESCTATRECVSGRVCRQLECVTPVEIDTGQPCGGESPCHDGAYCDPTTLLCADQRERDQPCNAFYGCKDGLACLGLVEVIPKNGVPVEVPTPGICGSWLDLGAACTIGGVTGCPTSSQSCIAGVCSQVQNIGGYRETCADRPCAEGLGCDRRQLCDYELAIFGDCGGDRAMLCEVGLVCSPTGTDAFEKPGTCSPPAPPACFSPPAST